MWQMISDYLPHYCVEMEWVMPIVADVTELCTLSSEQVSVIPSIPPAAFLLRITFQLSYKVSSLQSVS